MNHDTLVTTGKAGFALLTGYLFAQQTPIDVPGWSPLVEKGGSWALVAVLMYWILGKLSRQLDGLTSAVEKLTDHLGGK